MKMTVYVKRIDGSDVLYTRYPTKGAIPLVFPDKGAEKRSEDETEEKK